MWAKYFEEGHGDKIKFGREIDGYRKNKGLRFYMENEKLPPQSLETVFSHCFSKLCFQFAVFCNYGTLRTFLRLGKIGAGNDLELSSTLVCTLLSSSIIQPSDGRSVHLSDARKNPQEIVY